MRLLEVIADYKYRHEKGSTSEKIEPLFITRFEWCQLMEESDGMIFKHNFHRDPRPGELLGRVYGIECYLIE